MACHSVPASISRNWLNRCQRARSYHGAESPYPGIVYSAYSDRIDADHGICRSLWYCGWIPGRGRRVGKFSNSEDLQFESAPRNSFGWTFEDVAVKSAPGYRAPDTGVGLAAFSIAKVHDTRQTDGFDRNMVGLDQWVEARKFALLIIRITSPRGSSESPRWIDVNLAEQTLAVYDDDALVSATMIASGMKSSCTRPGLFQIQQERQSETMRNNDPTGQTPTDPSLYSGDAY